MLTREFISTVYVVNDGKVLLTWNKKMQNWVPVGGHIESNELPCQSVIREAKEESGFDIELISNNHSKTANLPQPVHVHLDHVRDDHEHINLIYFGKVKSGTLLPESDEQTPIKWFSKEDLEKENLIASVKEWCLIALNKL